MCHCQCVIDQCVIDPVIFRVECHVSLFLNGYQTNSEKEKGPLPIRIILQ